MKTAPKDKLCTRCRLRIAVRGETKVKRGKKWVTKESVRPLCEQCYLEVTEQFSPSRAAEARAAGMAASYNKACDEFKKAAAEAYVVLAQIHDVYTVDDVVQHLESDRDTRYLCEITDLSALGGVASDCEGSVFEYTGEVVRSRRVKAHKGYKRVYRSRLKPSAAGVTWAEFHPEDIVGGVERPDIERDLGYGQGAE